MTFVFVCDELVQTAAFTLAFFVVSIVSDEPLLYSNCVTFPARPRITGFVTVESTFVELGEVLSPLREMPNGLVATPLLAARSFQTSTESFPSLLRSDPP